MSNILQGKEEYFTLIQKYSHYQSVGRMIEYNQIKGKGGERAVSEYVLELKGITKIFPGVKALNNVQFQLKPGEVHALMGENGAGKSTFIKVITGVHKAEEGEMFLNGQKVDFKGPKDAQEAGIAAVYQHPTSYPHLTVAENIFLAETEKYKNKFGLVNRKKMNADATEVMKNIGVNDVTGDMQMQQLDFQTRKLVEIAKVVMKQPQILVIDETSTALSHDGRQVLYDIMNRFRKENKSVIFISHDLDEIMDVCDTLTVLRDGKIIRTFVKEEFEAGAIRASMIGRELQGDYYRSDFKATSQPQVALDVKNLIYGDRLKDISFQVKKGEIVGIGGLAHCGMHSLGKVCFGALKPESGSVSVSDGTIIDSPSKAMKKRLGYVSKDRDVESLCLNASIEDNISIAGMSEFAIKDFLVLKNREKKYVDNQIKELSIKCAGREQSVSQLSGGNKQKVVFGKWIGCGSEIIILDCPTRGVDIGVKQAMYQLMVKLKNEGKSILMISEELPELIGMSDRVLIMKDGEITMEFERSENLSDSQIIEYMI